MVCGEDYTPSFLSSKGKNQPPNVGGTAGFLKKSKKQIPRGLKPARNDKNNGLVRHG
jgi:hypothetical protein